jgi:hypothetical protein
MVAVIAASLIILFLPTFVATSVAQSINGIAAAMMPPAVAAITLGLVKQKGYAHQLGRNEAFNHAGNVTAALHRRVVKRDGRRRGRGASGLCGCIHGWDRGAGAGALGCGASGHGRRLW